MKKLRKTNGITLIALIITILVLLIIAGVVIGTINGGILSNANKSAEKYNSEARREEELLGTLESKLKDYTGEIPSTPDQPTKEPTNVEYFSWITTETEATITGFSDAGKAKYNAGEITELVIPSEYNGVTVTQIGDFAFSHCQNLIEINISNTITTIGAYAFSYTGIKEVFIPKNVKNISGNGCFGDSNNLVKVTFEEGTEKIPANIMMYCYGLTEVNMPNTVTTIGWSAFGFCKKLTKINIPNGVTKIDGAAFSNCTGLTEIKLPPTISSLGQRAFWECNGLTEVFIPKSLTSTSGPFEDCSNLVKVTFEEGTEKIPSNIMLWCTGLKEIVIPESVTQIGDFAFSHCQNLIEINISNTITTIGAYAFSYTGIKEVFIPKNVKNISGNGCFGDSNNLVKVTFEEGTEKIPANIMMYCYGLTEVNMPNTVTTIGWSAFGFCKKLTKINIPNGVTKIDGAAFSNCTGLTEIKLPSTISSLGQRAFWECKGLTEIFIPKSLTSTSGPFEDCSNLAKVTFEEGMKEIPYDVMLWCTGLKEINIPDSVEKIADFAFSNCTEIEEINIPQSIKRVGDYAFNNCKKLERINYTGTQDQWNAISIGSNNTPLTSATINYNQ